MGGKGENSAGPPLLPPLSKHELFAGEDCTLPIESMAGTCEARTTNNDVGLRLTLCCLRVELQPVIKTGKGVGKGRKGGGVGRMRTGP